MPFGCEGWYTLTFSPVSHSDEACDRGKGVGEWENKTFISANIHTPY